MTTEEAQAIIDYLATNRMVWQAGGINNNQFSNLRGDLTFFRATRCHGALRLYGWGGIGRFNEFPSQRPPALADPGLYDQCFPHNFHNLGIVDGSPITFINSLNSVQFPHVINTEEYYELSAAHNPLQDIVSIAAINFSGANKSNLACTAKGELYVSGVSGGISDGPNTPTLSYNAMGLGKFPPRDPDFANIHPEVQTALQRVYGDDPNFINVRFVKVQAARLAYFALDDDGYLWMSGSVRNFANAADFPENSTNLFFFRKREITQYYDKTAALVSDELLFTDFWVGLTSLLALTADGRLFGLGNRFAFGKQLDTQVFHEVGGFVDTVTVTNEGNFFSGDSGEAEFIEVEFSAPADPYGETATGFALIENPGASNSKLKGIVITNSGWGYTSPPTISFTRGGGSPPAGFEEAEAECTIYTGTWKHAAIAGGPDSALDVGGGLRYHDHYVAINQDGVVYSWGAVNDYSWNSSNTTVRRFVQGPRRMLGVISLANLSGTPQPKAYEKVFAGRFQIQDNAPAAGIINFGVAFDADNKLSFWGSTSADVPDSDFTITPILTQSSDALTLLVPTTGGHFVETDEFIDAACADRSVALVSAGNVIVTYGAFDSRDPSSSLNNFHAPSLGQGRDTYNEDAEGVGDKLRFMRRIPGGSGFVRVFASRTGLPNSSYYAVREPEELDPLYGTRISPRPPAEPLGEPD
jgi:hypothetical protein